MEVMVGLCRLCASLRKADALTSIKDESSETCEKLRHCCQLDIKIKDALPKSVCQECLDNLNRSYKFYLKVKEAQETLQALYPTSVPAIESEDVEENRSAALVTNLTIANKKHKKTKLNTGAQDKIKNSKEPANKKSKPDQCVLQVNTIKLEKVVTKALSNSSKESQSKQNVSSSKEGTSDNLNYLEEVYNMLDLAKEEVILDSSYEILETIEDTNDSNEIVLDIENENTSYENSENDKQRQFTEEANDLFEENYSESLENTVSVKKSLVISENESNKLNLELEYIEDEDNDDEISIRSDKNKFSQVKVIFFFLVICSCCDLVTRFT